MRSRGWRRYKEKIKIINRIKRCDRTYYRHLDANGNNIQNHIWLDSIGTYSHFMYKNYTIKYSEYKKKYGKRGIRYWENDSKIGNRQSNKIKFKKMLQEDYGIKHLNISYESIKNYTEQ